MKCNRSFRRRADINFSHQTLQAPMHIRASTYIQAETARLSQAECKYQPADSNPNIIFPIVP